MRSYRKDGTRPLTEGDAHCTCGCKLLKDNAIKCKRCGKEYTLQELIEMAKANKEQGRVIQQRIEGKQKEMARSL